jgi:hypothetical protein
LMFSELPRARLANGGAGDPMWSSDPLAPGDQRDALHRHNGEGRDRLAPSSRKMMPNTSLPGPDISSA